MSNYNKNISNWFKELVTIVIGGSLIGLFSLFFLPPIAIKYWWLIWLIASTGILLWRVLQKRKNPSQKKGTKRDGKAKKKKQKPIPPAIPKPWKIQSLGMEGFSLKGMRDQNPDAFPLKIKIRTPYVDGRSNPEKRQITGEDFDFLNDDTDIEYNGCQVTISESEIILEANDENFEIKIGGYDFNRMPEVFVRRL